MKERIINQPEIIKPEFYLEKVGKGGIEFVEQFLKTPGTLAHVLYNREENAVTSFLKNLWRYGEIAYKSYMVKREIALSLFVTDTDKINGMIAEEATFGIPNSKGNDKGFIIFNDEVNRRIRGKEYLDDAVLNELLVENQKKLIQQVDPYKLVGVIKMDDRFLYSKDEGLKGEGIRPFLLTMKYLRDLKKYKNGQISKNQVNDSHWLIRHLRLQWGIRFVGFDDDGVLKPLPIKIDEINYMGFRVRNDDCWRVYQMKQKSR